MTPRKNLENRDAGSEPNAESPSFEEAIERLETIVEELEGGTLSLEESISRYEEGMKLSRRLTQTLDQAEKRIERLMESESGAPTTEPMELEENANEPTRPGAPMRATERPRPVDRPPARAPQRAPSSPENDELPF